MRRASPVLRTLKRTSSTQSVRRLRSSERSRVVAVSHSTHLTVPASRECREYRRSSWFLNQHAWCSSNFDETRCGCDVYSVCRDDLSIITSVVYADLEHGSGVPTCSIYTGTLLQTANKSRIVKVLSLPPANYKSCRLNGSGLCAWLICCVLCVLHLRALILACECNFGRMERKYCLKKSRQQWLTDRQTTKLD